MADRIGGAMERLQPLRFVVTQVGAAPVPMTPGMAPGVQDIPGLFSVPAAPRDPVALLDETPINRPEGVTRGLGMEPTEEMAFRKFLGSVINSDNEAILRQQLNQYGQQHGFDPELRRVLVRRVLSYYKTSGKAQGSAERVRRAARGVTPDSVKMGADMQKAETFHIMLEKAEHSFHLAGTDLPDGKTAAQLLATARDEVEKEPGAAFPVLTDRMSALRGEDAAGQALRSLADRGKLQRDGDDFYPELWIIEKGGPGSGIRGHTSSGKPIHPINAGGPDVSATDSSRQVPPHRHARAASEAHPGFTAQDHRDAAATLRGQVAETTMPHGQPVKRGHPDWVPEYKWEQKLTPQQREERGVVGTKRRDLHDDIYAHEAAAEAKEKQLTKAEPRGGKYHARVTDRDSGKHRYFYDEEKFKGSTHAPVMGATVRKDKLRKDILDQVGDREVKRSDLRTDPRFEDDVDPLIKEMVGSGHLVWSGDALKKPGEPVTVRPEIFRTSMSRS